MAFPMPELKANEAELWTRRILKFCPTTDCSRYSCSSWRGTKRLIRLRSVQSAASWWPKATFAKSRPRRPKPRRRRTKSWNARSARSSWRRRSRGATTCGNTPRTHPTFSLPMRRPDRQRRTQVRRCRLRSRRWRRVSNQPKLKSSRRRRRRRKTWRCCQPTCQWSPNRCLRRRQNPSWWTLSQSSRFCPTRAARPSSLRRRRTACQPQKFRPRL